MIGLGDHEIGGDGGRWCPMICFGDHESAGVGGVDGVAVAAGAEVDGTEGTKGLALVL